jgi:hypothetical protein
MIMYIYMWWWWWWWYIILYYIKLYCIIYYILYIIYYIMIIWKLGDDLRWPDSESIPKDCPLWCAPENSDWSSKWLFLRLLRRQRMGNGLVSQFGRCPICGRLTGILWLVTCRLASTIVQFGLVNSFPQPTLDIWPADETVATRCGQNDPYSPVVASRSTCLAGNVWCIVKKKYSRGWSALIAGSHQPHGDLGRRPLLEYQPWIGHVSYSLRITAKKRTILRGN